MPNVAVKEITTRALNLRTETINEETRSVEAILATPRRWTPSR